MCGKSRGLDTPIFLHPIAHGADGHANADSIDLHDRVNAQGTDFNTRLHLSRIRACTRVMIHARPIDRLRRTLQSALFIDPNFSVRQCPERFAGVPRHDRVGHIPDDLAWPDHLRAEKGFKSALAPAGVRSQLRIRNRLVGGRIVEHPVLNCLGLAKAVP